MVTISPAGQQNTATDEGKNGKTNCPTREKETNILARAPAEVDRHGCQTQSRFDGYTGAEAAVVPTIPKTSKI